MVRSLKADPVVFALTGEHHPRSPGRLVDRLEACGWTRSRLSSFVAGRIAAGQPWPVPVPGDLVEDGYARLSAEITDARTELGLLGITARPAPARPLTVEERRLVAERPPHWA